MLKSRLLISAAILCMAGAAAAQTTDRPASSADPNRPTAAPGTAPAPSTAPTTPPSSYSSSPSAVSPSSPSPSASAPGSMSTERTTTETRTQTETRGYRDPATGRMTSDPARMDTARAPRYDRN